MKILIADDHIIIRTGLKYIISTGENNSEDTVIGEAENGIELLEKIKTLKPDLVILDIQMPGLTGLEAAKKIKEDFPEVIIIILSQFKEAKKVFEALAQGVNGYLLKESANDDLLHAINEAKEGRIFLSPELPEYSEILKQLIVESNRKRPWLVDGANDGGLHKDMTTIVKMKTYLDHIHTICKEAFSADGKIILQLNRLLHEEKIYTNEKLTLNKTAQLLALEPHILSNIIIANFSMTFPQLLNLYRVREAMQLLSKNKKMKSIEVAFESGFNSKTQYNHVFRELTSMSPVEYRDMQNQKFP